MTYTLSTVDVIETAVRDRDLSIDQLADMLNELPTSTRRSPEESAVWHGVARVYRAAIEPTIAPLSCIALLNLAADALSADGTTYVDGASAQRMAVITAELEERHPDVEPIDTWNPSAGIRWIDHERAVYLAAPACPAH